MMVSQSRLFSFQIIYKMEYHKNKAKGYTLPYDTPATNHMKRVKEITSNVRPSNHHGLTTSVACQAWSLSWSSVSLTF